MSFKELVFLIKSDISRYKATGARNTLRIIFLTQTFWATCFYRVFNYLYIKTSRIHFLRLPIALLYHINVKIIQILTQISIPVGTKVGSGLYLAHFGPIIISGSATIGDNCNLGNQVIIGFGRIKGKPGFPELGNRVFVGPGAKIFGPVKIGNDVSIGANAVVTEDVPPRATVIGIPAKIINFHGSFNYVIYKDMDQDPERKASLSEAQHQDPDYFIMNNDIVNYPSSD